MRKRNKTLPRLGRGSGVPSGPRPYRYNALLPPDPQQWLAFDEAERLDLVREYHRRTHFEAPRIEIHNALHVTVETQIAMGDEVPAVQRAAKRLLSDGLNRHEMIHAIAEVLLQQVYDVHRGLITGDINPSYNAALDDLTAESWRSLA